MGDIDQSRQPRPAIVSYEWLIRCIETEKLLDCTAYPHFSALPEKVPYLSMMGLSISITGFLGDQRHDLISLIRTLGCRYNDKFSRKETHLLCKEPSGEKYKRAVEIGTAHIVSIEWIFACATQVFEGTMRLINIRDNV